MFNVEFCLYSTYISPYTAAGMASSAGHLYCAPLLPSHAPIVLSHSVSFIGQVCLTVRVRRLGDHYGLALPTPTRVRKIGATTVALNVGSTLISALV